MTLERFRIPVLLTLQDGATEGAPGRTEGEEIRKDGKAAQASAAESTGVCWLLSILLASASRETSGRVHAHPSVSSLLPLHGHVAHLPFHLLLLLLAVELPVTRPLY